MSVAWTTGGGPIGSGFTGQVGGPGSARVAVGVERAACAGVGAERRSCFCCAFAAASANDGVHVGRCAAATGAAITSSAQASAATIVVRWVERVVSTVASWPGLDWSRGKLE